MKKYSSDTLLLIAGSFVCSGALILSRVMILQDTVRGTLTGIGAGLLILSLIQKKRKNLKQPEM